MLNECVYEDLHGKKWLYTYGAILRIFKKNKKKKRQIKPWRGRMFNFMLTE